MASVMRYRYGPHGSLTIKKTGTVAIEVGDMVKRPPTGNPPRIMAVSAATDARDFLGVAMTASPTTDPTATPITVFVPEAGTVFEMKLSAAGLLKFGQPLKISAAQTLAVYGTAGTDLYTSATNVVAIVAKDMDKTASTCLVRFLGSYGTRTIVAA